MRGQTDSNRGLPEGLEELSDGLVVRKRVHYGLRDVSDENGLFLGLKSAVNERKSSQLSSLPVREVMRKRVVGAVNVRRPHNRRRRERLSYGLFARVLRLQPFGGASEKALLRLRTRVGRRQVDEALDSGLFGHLRDESRAVFVNRAKREVIGFRVFSDQIYDCRRVLHAPEHTLRVLQVEVLSKRELEVSEG